MIHRREAGRRQQLAVAAALLAGLTACSYRGGIDNPATIKTTWISYLNGDDIRAACTEGAPLSYRLIYNSDYDVQLRSYEVAGDGAGGATMTARVQGPSGLVVNEAIFSDSLGFARRIERERPLDAAQRDALDAALEASGAFAPAPRGLQLFSKETYWITSLCRDGTFHFNAWRYPSDRFDAISFDELLFALDDTGIAVRAPVAVPSTAAANVPRRRESSDERGNYFLVKVGDNGFTDRLTF
ncbi:hypothetical protein [Pelagibius sp. 7325]|uniref:hypothetical protein n=1 Tax=Pelagibius sp. 7325 TaxID=3131994 RepID=UPI0030EEC140